MKNGVIRGLIFFSIPLGILVTAVLNREPRHEGKTALEWYQSITRLSADDTAPNPELEAMLTMGAKAVPSLKRVLRSSDYNHRFRAALILGKMGPIASEAVDDLAELLRDRHPVVQMAGIEALTKIRTTRGDIIPHLLKIMKTPDNGGIAATLLDQIEQDRRTAGLEPLQSSDDYILQFVNSRQPVVRYRAVPKVCNLADGATRTNAILRLLNDKHNWTATLMVKHLKDAERPETVLFSRMKDKRLAGLGP